MASGLKAETPIRLRLFSFELALGRFLSRDPLGYHDSMGLYSAFGQNPISYNDPWGLQSLDTYSEAGSVVPSSSNPGGEREIFGLTAKDFLYPYPRSFPPPSNGGNDLFSDTSNSMMQDVWYTPPTYDKREISLIEATLPAHTYFIHQDPLLLESGRFHWAITDWGFTVDAVLQLTATGGELIVTRAFIAGRSWMFGTRVLSRTVPCPPQITEAGLKQIEAHLARLGALDDPANAAMLARLKAGETTVQDINFYMHELTESTIMGRTGGYGIYEVERTAHLEALQQQGIAYIPGYEAQIYHPNVIRAYQQQFNPSAWPK